VLFRLRQHSLIFLNQQKELGFQREASVLLAAAMAVSRSPLTGSRFLRSAGLRRSPKRDAPFSLH
jgi:hypothetical protein